MSQEWDIKARSGLCQACLRPFIEKMPYVGVLSFGLDGYTRRDLCETCWSVEKPTLKAFSTWQGLYRMPPPKAVEAIPKENAESLLRKLLESDDASKCSVMYILAVMLERKRILVERDVKRSDAGITRVYEHKRTGETFIIPDPELKLSELRQVQEEVSALLNAPSEQAVSATGSQYDILILDSMIIDGTGTPAYKADIAIRGDEIVEIGDLQLAEAAQVIRAPGAYTCPGFIDAHSHSDTYLLVEPLATSKLYQGITTEVVGNCGASAAPLLAENYHLPSDWRAKSYPGKWRTVAEYKKLVEEAKPAPNVVLLVGHNTLRVNVSGYENRHLTEAELDTLCQNLEQALDEGARGLSSGLVYSPGNYAPTDELIRLAAVLKKKDAIYTTHMRSESSQLLEAIEEAISIGRAGGIRVQISHLKTSGRKNWHLLDKAFAIIEAAQAEGITVMSDRYPYIAAGTDLDIILPEWAGVGGRDAVVARLRDMDTRRKIRNELNAEKAPTYWADVMVGSTTHPDNTRFRGKTLAEVGQSLGIEGVDAALHLMETDELHTSAFFFGMSEENMVRILKKPYVMIGSDASLRAPTGPMSDDYPHPRAYGTFPRVLRMAIDNPDFMSVEELVRKMTSLTATQFGLTDRGEIAKGKKADITIWNPTRIRDIATYAAPHGLAEGVDHVIVNGTLTLTGGQPTGYRSGRFL
jgi:N-acyl-D-amino-acid deacylase